MYIWHLILHSKKKCLLFCKEHAFTWWTKLRRIRKMPAHWIRKTPAIKQTNPTAAPTTAPTIIVVGMLDADEISETGEMTVASVEEEEIFEADGPVIWTTSVPLGNPFWFKLLFSKDWFSIFIICELARRTDVWTRTAVAKSNLRTLNVLLEISFMLRILTSAGETPAVVEILRIYLSSLARNAAWDMGNVTTMTTVS